MRRYTPSVIVMHGRASLGPECMVCHGVESLLMSQCMQQLMR